VYALYAESTKGLSKAKLQVGLLADSELAHHLSLAPPSQSSAVIPVVLQTINLTVSAVPPVSESKVLASVEKVNVAPGFLGPSLLIALKVGLWFTAKGDPLDPDP
jgi:hypothetical protein